MHKHLTHNNLKRLSALTYILYRANFRMREDEQEKDEKKKKKIPGGMSLINYN